MTESTRPVAISVEHVIKRFTLRKTRELKEAVVWLLTRRQRLTDESFLASNDVSFDVHEGETVALLGYNGSGKSTMLKMISGVLTPDGGRIRTKGRIAGLIEVGAGFHHDLTGRENVYLNGAILGMDEKEIDQKFQSIIDFAEIGEFIDTEVKFYSSGMYLRLAFAVAVHTDPDIFLIDEILAVGDEPFQRKCLAKIKEFADRGKTLVVVSHDLDMVKRVCDRGVVLRKGVKAFDGEIGDAVEWLRAQG